MVNNVAAGSVFEQLGLQNGDLLTSIQGQPVTNLMGLPMPCPGNFADVYAVVTPQRSAPPADAPNSLRINCGGLV